MQSRDVTIRLQSLGGHWDTVGVDQARGIHPENVVASSNPWGNDAASFDLKRDPGATWPDLSAFTPVEIESGGQRVWTGRVKETPTRDGLEKTINVQCEGWQYHLDDDVYERSYLHNSLPDWKDCRGDIDEILTNYTTAGSVSSGVGASIGWAKGAQLPTFARVGIRLDMGVGQAALAAAVNVKGITGPGNSAAEVYVRGTNDVPEATGASDAATATLATIGTSASPLNGTFSTPRRYVTIFLFIPAAVTLNQDVTLQITGAQIASDSSYLNLGFGFSTMTAPIIITDALTRVAPNLSTDRSAIDPGGTVSFHIPSLSAGEPKTAREVISAVNAYHDYVCKVDVEKRVVFKPKPTVPDIEVGAWSGMDVQDASTNSGEEIYNQVIVTATSPDGHPVRAIRSQYALNLPYRRGFIRTKVLPVQSTMPTDLVAANQIADTYLAGHTSTPFKGTVTLTGGVRNILSGTTAPLQSLLARTGDLLRFSDRVDPDGGNIGRDGRIAAVSYDFDKDQATVTIDNSRASFEALLQRLSVVTGAG